MPWLVVAALVAASDLPPSLSVRLYPSADVDPAMVTAGNVVAASVLERAGLSPRWILCPAASPEPGCAGASGRDTIIVRVQTGLPAQTPCGEAQMSPEFRGGQLATLRVACVARVAARTQVAVATVFGTTLVHEIAHLLLGPGHHGFGLMQSFFDRVTWFRADAGRLNFAPDEAAALRQALADRTAGRRSADDGR